MSNQLIFIRISDVIDRERSQRAYIHSNFNISKFMLKSLSFHHQHLSDIFAKLQTRPKLYSNLHDSDIPTPTQRREPHKCLMR